MVPASVGAFHLYLYFAVTGNGLSNLKLKSFELALMNHELIYFDYALFGLVGEILCLLNDIKNQQGGSFLTHWANIWLSLFHLQESSSVF